MLTKSLNLCRTSFLLVLYYLVQYFAVLGLVYILAFSCMLVFQCRKGIQRKQRAKAWVERMKTERFAKSPLAHSADKEAQPGIKTEVPIPESESIAKQGAGHVSSEATQDAMGDSFLSLPDADPCKPVFHEVSWACALAHLPPLLEHSASYPCSNIPTTSTPFNSPLKFAVLKNESHHVGSNISA